MSKRLNDARHHADMIQHYYKNASINRYSQAAYHLARLEEVYGKSAQAGKDSDTIVLRGMVESAQKLLNEMKAEEQADPNGPKPL